MKQEKQFYEFLEPWSSAYEESDYCCQDFCDRLQAAIGPDHVLYGLPVRLAGFNFRSNDALFEILDGTGRLAFVELTFEEIPESSPSSHSVIYRDFEAFAEGTMVPQHRDYLTTPDLEQLRKGAEVGDLGLIRHQFALGADIDAFDFPYGTALSTAAENDQIEAAKLLIELGADLEKTDDSPMPKTALFMAVSNGHEDMARLLLEHGADPNAMFLTWSSTPRNCLEFLKSRKLDNTSLYMLLLDYGAELPTYVSMVNKYPEKTAYITEAVVSAEHFNDAIELTTYLIGKQPSSMLHYQRGVAYDMTNNLVLALSDFDAALALDSANYQALYSRSLVRRKLGRWQESVADLEAAIKINPSDYISLNALAFALLRSEHKSMRNPERAVTLANDACKLSDWEDALCIATLAEAYRKTGSESKAIEMDQMAAKLQEREALL